MRPSSEARFGIRLLLVLQILTSLAGVAMLGRMSPAVERILMENVYSTEAVEEMLEVLTTRGEPARFHAAFARAKGNVTEQEEVPLLDQVEAHADAALRGDHEALVSVSTALRELSQVNRASMQRADATASRLGLAGAWAMPLLGFVGFLVSLVVTRRVETRLLAPILEVDAVLAAAREGDEFRRCGVPADGEGSRLMANLNWLLDKRGGAPHCPTEDADLRWTVVALLDHLTDQAAVLLDDGDVVAANETALRDGVQPRAVAAQVREGEAPQGWAAHALGDGLTLVVRHGDISSS